MPFATVEDIAARRGRPLSEAEEESAEFLIDAAQAVIEGVVGKDEAAIGAVPAVLKYMTVEKVIRAMGNPQGLSSQSEALGAYSYTERFNSSINSDLLLTPLEENMVRKAVHGRLSGTAQVESLASDLCVLCRLAPSMCRCAALDETVGS